MKLIVAFRNFTNTPKNTSPLLCKTKKAHKISILQGKQGGGSVVDVTNALTDRISANYLGYSSRWSYHLLIYIYNINNNFSVNQYTDPDWPKYFSRLINPLGLLKRVRLL